MSKSIKKTPLEEVGVELIWTELLCLENYYEYLCVHNIIPYSSAVVVPGI